MLGGRLQIQLQSRHRGVVVRDLKGRERAVGGDAAPCYVHLSGVPGPPQFVARMQPEIIMRSEDAIDEVPLGERATHWLSSPSRDGKTVWETSPYLLVGTGAWNTDVASFPEPAMARYGRVGAPGSPWWVMVKRSDK